MYSTLPSTPSDGSYTFRIVNTFSTSFMRLTSDEQKAAKITAFNLRVDSSDKVKTSA